MQQSMAGDAVRLRASLAAVFRSLRVFNYRVWAAGALISNVGTWMQRTAQDWLVFTQLTRHDASAVGIVMSLQYGPQLLLLPWTGFVGEHRQPAGRSFLNSSGMVSPCTNTEKATTANVTVTIAS